MKIVFSAHALKRLEERGLTRAAVQKAAMLPDKTEVSTVMSNRFLAKKIYRNEKFRKDHLLMIIFEKREKNIEIITVIDTSKISRYF